jgi:hypothetical protein
MKTSGLFHLRRASGHKNGHENRKALKTVTLWRKKHGSDSRYQLFFYALWIVSRFMGLFFIYGIWGKSSLNYNVFFGGGRMV